jgi:hypothetical protein
VVVAEPVRPPIPLALAHRPTVGGLVVPWVNITLADGGVDFRGIHNSKWLRAWQAGLCQVCGNPLLGHVAVVLLGGPNQLASYFDEAPLHPWCASYTAKACPMVAGRLERYAARPQVSEGHRGKACPEPGCDCGGWQHHGPARPHGGDPAHQWWAVWCRSYSLAVTPQGRLLGGVPVDERRRRLISSPAAVTTGGGS